MDYLIDTNVLIPLEPSSFADVEPLTGSIAQLVRMIPQTGNRVVVHPESLRELGNDLNAERRELRLVLAGKYPQVEIPPHVDSSLEQVPGLADPGSHDSVDMQLLAALTADAAAFLITEDAALHRKASKVGARERVLTVVDALELLRTLYERIPPAPRAVETTTADEIDTSDPIFNGLRIRYLTFDAWWSKIAGQRRRVWFVPSEDGRYAALAVIKEEAQGQHGLFGRVLKICTFKVSEHAAGGRYGELLLNTVFDYAEANHFSTLYVEVDPCLGIVIQFLEDFGFVASGATTEIGDIVMAKERRPPAGSQQGLDPFDFHRLYGPPLVLTRGVAAWLVPIQPTFHRRLFPVAEAQQPLVPVAEPHGNSIRKAYLCKASVRSLRSGDLLYFYKSQEQTISVVGIVEDVAVLSQAEDIVRTAGKRTVYSESEIEDQAIGGGDVLVIGFRLVRWTSDPVTFAELEGEGILSGPPQSIGGVRSEKGALWLAERMGL